jgi:hypothetical protein
MLDKIAWECSTIVYKMAGFGLVICVVFSDGRHRMQGKRGRREKRRKYVAPTLKKGESLRRITAQSGTPSPIHD